MQVCASIQPDDDNENENENENLNRYQVDENKSILQSCMKI